MSDFDVQAQWKGGKSSKTIEDATFCDLEIRVLNRIVTQYTSEYEESSKSVELPVYGIGEWIAENWWSILWEPRKSEDNSQDDADFISRHSLLAAQRGFILPNVSFVSNGQYTHVVAKARDVPASDVRFIRSASAVISRDELQAKLGAFVAAVVDRLELSGKADTVLQLCWKAIENTEPDAAPYCQMMGALGLSPYAEHPHVDAIIEEFVERCGEAFALELCMVSSPEELAKTSRTAQLAYVEAGSSNAVDISRIAETPCPSDNLTGPAWERGARAARSIREVYGVAQDDPNGATAIFDRMQVDPTKRATIGKDDLQADRAAIVGAALRLEQNVAKLSFIQRHEYQRRFAAARGLFSAWTTKVHSGHLLTQAVTRYQQTNRAFAAELLAPIAYLRNRATRNVLSTEVIDDIAEEFKVGPDVVAKQAMNYGLTLRAY